MGEKAADTRPPRRLLGQVELIGAAVAALLVLIVVVGAHWVVGASAIEHDDSLVTKARRIASEEKPFRHLMRRSELGVAESANGLRLAFIRRDAKHVVASPNDLGAARLTLGPAEAAVAKHRSDMSVRTVLDDEDQPWRVVAVPSQFGAVVVAQPHEGDQQSAFMLRSLAWAAMGALAAALLTGFGIRRILRPLTLLASRSLDPQGTGPAREHRQRLHEEG